MTGFQKDFSIILVIKLLSYWGSNCAPTLHPPPSTLTTHIFKEGYLIFININDDLVLRCTGIFGIFYTKWWPVKVDWRANFEIL